jgi:hypothetical protein
MQAIHEKLIGMQKQAPETPSDGELGDAQRSGEEWPTLPNRNIIQATYRLGTQSSELTFGAYGNTGIEASFRKHHTSTAQRHSPYEHYRLVYRYGYDLGTDTRYRDADWSNVELAARPRWEERNPATWEQFKEMIWYAWDTARCLHGAGKTMQ